MSGCGGLGCELGPTYHVDAPGSCTPFRGTLMDQRNGQRGVSWSSATGNGKSWRELTIYTSTGWGLTRWTAALQKKTLSVLVDNKLNISYKVMIFIIENNY